MVVTVILHGDTLPQKGAKNVTWLKSITGQFLSDDIASFPSSTGPSRCDNLKSNSSQTQVNSSPLLSRIPLAYLSSPLKFAFTSRPNSARTPSRKSLLVFFWRSLLLKIFNRNSFIPARNPSQTAPTCCLAVLCSLPLPHFSILLSTRLQALRTTGISFPPPFHLKQLSLVVKPR